MAIKFQYNKIYLQKLRKDLTLREKALPTIKNKEAALRIEVKKAKDELKELQAQYKGLFEKYSNVAKLWTEFEQDAISIEDVKLSVKKVAGIKTPALEKMEFKIKPVYLFAKPSWFLFGVQIVKEMVTISIKQAVVLKKTEILEFARKKTTQKVNLYEKVQIPGYKEAVLKIKRFMEDEENLSKSSQKIVKQRHLQEEEV